MSLTAKIKNAKFTKWIRSPTPVRLLHDEVSITKNGSIHISQEFEQDYFTSDKIMPFYDPKLHLIGLIPSDNLGYCLKYQNKSCRTKRICVRKLIVQLDAKVGRYHAEWDKNLGMLVFEYQQNDSVEEEKS